MGDAVAAYGLSAINTPAQNREVLDRAIVQAAGGETYIAAGVYPINPLTIVTPGTHLRFAPGAILQVVPDTKYHPSFINIAASDVVVDGGEFDGNGVAGAYGIMAVRITGSSSNIIIRNCVVRNTSGGIGAYNVVNCSNWVIDGCTIDTTVSGYGIFLHGNPSENHSTTGVRVINNLILNTEGNGIWIGNKFADVTVTGNFIAGCGRMGIEVWRNPTGRFVIDGNVVKECRSFGISVSDTPDTICANNIVHRATGYGIEVADCRFVALTGNHIDTVLVKEDSTKPTGISLNSLTNDAVGDVSIQGGTISGCTSAINVSGGQGRRNNIAVSGVVIKDCTYGIRVVGTVGQNDGGGMVDDLAISGCTIKCSNIGIGNSVYGGLIRGGVISGNNIHVTKGPGIDLFRPAELLITGNRIRGENVEKSIGIRVWDHTAGALRTENVVIKNNHIVCFETPYFYRGVAGQVVGD